VTLNLGGGLGIIYRKERTSTALQFAKAVIPLLRGHGLRLLIEPGRFIVGNAGVLLTRVLYVKPARGKTFVIVDSGMNDLIRPALYGAHHEILPVDGRRRRASARHVDVVGPICESSDFLAQDRQMPLPEAGDLLAVRSAGAYGFVMSSNYNTRPRAAEALVSGRGSRWRVGARPTPTWCEASVCRRSSAPRGDVDVAASAGRRIPFLKMSGAGNDFVVIDNRAGVVPEPASRFAARVCARQAAVSADGLLLLERSERKDFRMRYFNTDGSEAEMCGNGGRCIARFATLVGLPARTCSSRTWRATSTRR